MTGDDCPFYRISENPDEGVGDKWCEHPHAPRNSFLTTLKTNHPKWCPLLTQNILITLNTSI
jgi:hypothetical protein